MRVGGDEYISSIHIFRFKTDAGLQVDTDFNTESKFSFSSSSFFSLLSGHSKPTKPMKLLSSSFICWPSVKPEHFV